LICPENPLKRHLPIVLFLITILSRLPFVSRYLYHLDSGQFALALDNYDLVLHQPHPPGYLLYVMSGRLVNLLVHDPNMAFILPGILFSALTVVAVYRLAYEMYDLSVGTVAALLTAFSPNFWFHGEVALSYSADAFFSAITGLLCWRAYRHARRAAPASAAVLAIAGGFRQSTPVFLLPLWLFSVRKESFRTILASMALFCAVCLAWFLPMVYLTGGMETYLAALRELWLFNTGHNSVFEKGIGHLEINVLYLNAFIFYTLGVALPFLPVALYALFRSDRLSALKDERAGFMACWLIPSMLFYLLIFISGNPGYILIVLPPLVIATAVSLCFINTSLQKITGRNSHFLLPVVLVFINSLLFLFGNLPVSRADIKTHDAGIQAIVQHISRLDYRTTALFISPDSFYSYRHLMVYLPRFTVYQVDVRTGPNGERRRQFGGKTGSTFLSESITPPEEIKHFAAVIDESSRNRVHLPPGLSVDRVAPRLLIASGPISRLGELYPELRP